MSVSYKSKILYTSPSLNLNITPERCKRTQSLRVRKHKFEPWGGSEGGRVLWRRLLLLAAAESCCELQCRTPPHIAAAELTHFRGKAGRRKSSLTAQEKKQERKQPWEVVRTGQDHPLCSFHGWTELPEILMPYYWSPFNNWSPTSCVSEDSSLVFFLKDPNYRSRQKA